MKPEQSFPLVPVLSNLNEFEPEKLEPEIVYRLATARLVFADYDLLQHDFPFLRNDSLVKNHSELQQIGAADKTKAIKHILNEWLMTNAAFVSARQRRQSVVKSQSLSRLR